MATLHADLIYLFTKYGATDAAGVAAAIQRDADMLEAVFLNHDVSFADYTALHAEWNRELGILNGDPYRHFASFADTVILPIEQVHPRFDETTLFSAEEVSIIWGER